MILLFSDVHVYCHKRSPERLEHCLRALEWVFDTAKRHGINEVVFAGDLFQDRQLIDVYTYHRTYRTLAERLDGTVKLYMLLGNHDLWFRDRWDVSSVAPLASLPGVTVIDRPCTLPVAGVPFDFCPYSHNPAADLAALPKSKVLVGHLAVDGAQMNKVYDVRSDVVVEHDGEMIRIGPALLADWDRVFLGHYHGAQMLSPGAEYVGSPLQLSFGEAFQDKHVILYDPHADKTTYVVNDFSPRHYIVRPDELDKYDLKDHFVRIDADDLAAPELVEIRHELGQTAASLEFQPADARADEERLGGLRGRLQDYEALLRSFVEQADVGDMDRHELLEMGVGLCRQASGQ